MERAQNEVSFEEVTRKRSMLASARLQFSPESQEVREQAIDTCIEHIFFGLDAEAGTSLGEIKQILTSQFGASAFVRDGDLKAAVERGVSANRLDIVSDGRYRLAEGTRSNIAVAEQSAKNRLNAVASVLFAGVGRDFPAYRECFYEALGVIFSELGEQYVRVLTQRAEKSVILKSPVIQTALRFVKTRYRQIDHRIMSAAVTRFFEATNPDFDALKWNLAQNHYVAKCLGLDAGGQLLSGELFGTAILIFDTNVALHGVCEASERHVAFRGLVELCRVLGTRIEVCHVSLDEARGVIAGSYATLRKVEGVVPPALANRVNDLFYQAYRQGAHTDPDAFFARYERLADNVRALGLEVVDDHWFVDDAEIAKLAKLKERIKEASKARKPYPKSDRAALHDAQLLAWSGRESSANAPAWIVTLDRSLATVAAAADVPVGNVISLDALLQWLAPIAVQPSIEFARIFSESLKCQLLPAENFFDLEDFIIFAEMEWDCRTLPPEDVESCIRAIRASAGVLDPRSPRDREKLARRVRKFFADPSRKFNEEREEYEATILKFERQTAEADRDHEKAIGSHREEISRMRTEVDELRGTVGDLRRDIRQTARDIGAVGDERDAARKQLRNWRVGIAVVFLSLGLVMAVVAADAFGDGKNLWQRVGSSWELLCFITLVGTYVSALIAGREGLGTWGLPLSRFLSPARDKNEPSSVSESEPTRPIALRASKVEILERDQMTGT